MQCLALVLLSLSTVLAHGTGHHGKNFVRIESKNGQRTTWVTYKDILAKEMKTMDGSELSMRLVQRGDILVQAVVKDGRVEDCDIIEAGDVPAEKAFGAEFASLPAPEPRATAGKDQESFYVSEEDDIPDYARQLLDVHGLVKVCKRVHKRLASAAKQKSRRDRSSRIRRGAGSLIFEGTKWCGKGTTAKHFHDLGEHIDTDKCCRDHDHCPYTIEGFVKKYGLFNIRFHTISHCDCDYRFRTCLKNTNTAVSRMIGNIFFNFVNTVCFDFTTEKVCTKRSWWYKCTKYETQYKAVLRDALQYNSM